MNRHPSPSDALFPNWELVTPFFTVDISLPPEQCTCGSGAHPRHCVVHPENYAKHVAELQAENDADNGDGETCFACFNMLARGQDPNGFAHTCDKPMNKLAV